MMGFEQYCPKYDAAAELLGKRWTGLIIRTLLAGPKRFGEIRSMVPDLSDRLLSERLKELEENQIVERVIHTGRPVVVIYQLTAKGRDMESVVEAIQAWAERWFSLRPDGGAIPIIVNPNSEAE